MSRKLIFAAGLLVCFECHLDPEAEQARLELRDPKRGITELIRYLERQFSMPPLEILARSARRHGTSKTATLLFDSYDAFLALLDDPDKRAILRDLDPSQSRTDPVFKLVREISHAFQEGLTHLFFRDHHEQLYKLIEFYGVF
jgi:hypothetical protein